MPHHRRMETTDTLHPDPESDQERWDRIRDYYLDGEPAWSVCRNFGIALSTFRARAKRDGWRRCDQSAEAEADDEAPDDAPFDPDLLVIQARAHLRRAVTAGDALGTLRWMKAVEQLTDFARRERHDQIRHAPDRNRALDDAIEAARRRRERLEGAEFVAERLALDSASAPSPESEEESSAAPAPAPHEASDPLEDSDSLYDQLDSLDSFFSEAELAAHPELADAVRAMSALSPLLREQAERRAAGP